METFYPSSKTEEPAQFTQTTHKFKFSSLSSLFLCSFRLTILYQNIATSTCQKNTMTLALTLRGQPYVDTIVGGGHLP